MIKLNAKYKSLLTTESRVTLITGGRGSAKSFAVSTFLCLLSFEQNQRILYTRQTMTSAHLSVIPEFREKISIMNAEEKFNVNKAEIKNIDSGSEILFKGILSSSGNNTAQLKSLSGITVWCLDEAEESDEVSFDKINLSIRTKGVQNRIILILNPATREHWIYKRFFEQLGVNPGHNGEVNGVNYIHTTYLDNINNLDHSFIQQVEQIKLSNPEKYKHVILGGWLSKAEGVIFNNWSIGHFDNDLPHVWGMDFGWSIDPTTLTKVAIDRRLRKIYVKEYIYKIGLTTNDIYLACLKFAGLKDLITADSAEPRLISELQALGLNVISCTKGPGSITAGISAMQDFEIIVDPESTNIIKEFNNYVWHDKKSSVPMDAFNHSIDGIRYAAWPIIKMASLDLESEMV